MISKKEFEEQLEYLQERYGELRISENEDGTKTILVIKTQKHLGTYKIR